MAISGSVKDHNHINEYFQRSGNWAPGNDTVLKFPDGTMIQTKTVIFSPSRKQPSYYNYNHVRYDASVGYDIYNYHPKVDQPTDTGYTHGRNYQVNWKEPFKPGTIPQIFQHYKTSNHFGGNDRFFAITKDKTTNSEIAFFHYDQGGEQIHTEVTFLGIGLWK